MVWSVSADRVWKRCQRQYFFKQIMGYGKVGHNKMRQQASLLRKVKDIPAWQGIVTHKAIEEAILPVVQSGFWPTHSNVLQYAAQLVEAQFTFSERHLYEKYSKAEKGDEFCILAPHYFGETGSEITLENAFIPIQTALTNLLTNQTLQSFLMGRRKYWWEQWLYFSVDDTTIRATPDLVMSGAGWGGLDLVDWKVATTSTRYDFQIATYALAAHNASWLANAAQKGVHGYVINLLATDPAEVLTTPYIITQQVLNATTDRIYESKERIRAIVGNRRFNQLNIGEFAYSQSVGTCATCNWRKLCVEMGDGTPAKPFPDHESGSAQLALPLA